MYLIHAFQHHTERTGFKTTSEKLAKLLGTIPFIFLINQTIWIFNTEYST